MNADLAAIFQDCSVRRLQMHLSRIERCLPALTEEQIWMRGSANENAIGNLVLHLGGNVRQWILSGVGGQPDTRVRDGEFAARSGASKPELFERLKTTVDQACAVIAGLNAARLAEKIAVQNYNLSVMEAVYHVVDHFAQHTAQIIYATKMLTQADLGFYRHLANPAHSEKTP